MPLIDKSVSVVSMLRPMYDYLDRQKDNQKFIRSLEIAATFTLISFFLIFAIMPTASAISGLIGEIKAKETMVKTLKVKINNVITAQDNFSQIQEKYTLINTSLPDRPDYYGATNQVVGIMKELGINPGKISFNLNSKENPNSKTQKNINSYSINFPLNPEFNQSKNLITRLVNNRRTSSFPSVSFSILDTQEGSRLGLNLIATYYYWDSSP